MKSYWNSFISWLAGLHDGRPPASTFAEGQQALMVKLLARCGIVATLIVVCLTGFFIHLIMSGKHPELQTMCLWGILGVVGLYGLTNLAIVLSFAVGGPVGRIDLEATRNGIKAGASKNPGRENSDADVNRTLAGEVGAHAESGGEVPQAGT